ncbi:(Fe-S)-binding protein [Nocardiopsis sp. CNT-189]|uniref:(Fe-S)-binding protein n=1 Tax=Nocardiopsis oceanisediminis TaxID=2816862 RepID=UPI003B2E4231
MRVGLFVACLTDAVFPETGRAAVRLLRRLGCAVVYPQEQTCCGQAHHTSGYRREATGLAARFAEVFDGCELVVTPSASCAAMVRDHYPALAGREPRIARAPRTLELTEFLVDVLGAVDVGASFPHRVAYHPACQALRSLRTGDRPLRLLREVRGLELVELPGAEECCGFGGAFAWKNADTSVAMVADKVRRIGGSGAEVVCSDDDACLMQIGGALSRLRGGVRAVHLAEILAETAPAPGRARR